MTSKDRFKDQDTITIINILKGYVCSIIANFSSGTGIILKHSDSTPRLFGYKVREFEQITTINEIMPTIIAA